MKACTRFDQSEEHGAGGDLTYGRPGIAEVRDMFKKLAEGVSEVEGEGENAGGKIKEDPADTAAADEMVSAFAAANQHAFDEHVSKLPASSLAYF